MKEIFFQSSLPRSGSTLLQNILAQNPDFYATPTSGLIELLYNAKTQYTNLPEFKSQDKETMKSAFTGYCKGALIGYFNGITDKKYVIDKSRAWGVNYNFLNTFYKNPKIISMIRDPRDIFTSMELLHRNPHTDSGITDNINLQGTTLEKRIDIWASTVPLGLSLDWLKDIISQKINKNILFIKYENLVNDPQKELNRIYKFFDIDQYKHDFNHIEQTVLENDQFYGMFDHTIQNQIKKEKSKSNDVLGPHVCNWIKQNYEWFYKEFKYY